MNDCVQSSIEVQVFELPAQRGPAPEGIWPKEAEMTPELQGIIDANRARQRRAGELNVRAGGELFP